MKLQNEFNLKPWLLMNWNRPAVGKCYLFYSILTLTKSKYFVTYTIKFTANNDEVALLTGRCSERGTRNRHQRIFRKVLTIRKCWSKD